MATKPQPRSTKVSKEPTLALAPFSTDCRSPLARAEDDFLRSDTGSQCCDAKSLRVPHDLQQYLKNRISIAFRAGASAADKLSRRAVKRRTSAKLYQPPV